MTPVRRGGGGRVTAVTQPNINAKNKNKNRNKSKNKNKTPQKAQDYLNYHPDALVNPAGQTEHARTRTLRST